MARQWTAEERAAASAAYKARMAARKAEETAKAAVPYPVLAMPPIVHEDDVPAPAMPVEPDGALAPPYSTDDFGRFLAEQDAETREAFTEAELRVMYNTKCQAAVDERKTVLKKRVEARALRHARASAGLIGPETLAASALREQNARLVTWTINMPEAGNSGQLVDEGVRIDGKLQPHGTQVTGTLAEYKSYREIESRLRENERQFQGRSRMSRLSQTGMRFLHNEGQT
jgi:cell fate (sporulation/competence/biofilm development) regulator YmcA (YheA/YmcA/DUF963 family)